jgi:solute carrier family 45 protein 1/2/4
MAGDERNGELPESQREAAALVATVEIEEEEGQSNSAKQSTSGAEHDGIDKWNEPLWSAKGDPAGQLGLSKLALASMVAAGVQFGWALQLSLLTPYIQMLGIEHAFSSFIWLCGPITGLIVQPCIGMWSDQCTSKWGRRRPFIAVGVVMISISVIIIGYSADIGYLLGDSHEDCQVFKGVRPRAAFVFIIGFWLLDLANNTVQGPARALLADLSGSEQRDAANAIFCLWMALGNILGFSTGSYGNLYRVLPGLTSRACCVACANLKAAFLLAILFLAICTTVTLVAARETPLVVVIRKEQQLVDRKRSTGGAEPEGKQQEDVAPLLMIHKEGNGSLHDMTMVSVDLHQEKGDAPHDVAEENASHHSHMESSSPEDGIGTGLGAVMVNLLLGVRKLNGSMKIVLVVMALCWLSWFPFFLFDTDWMGREVYEGDPKGNSTQVTAYLRGVGEGSFGLLLNSVVLGISSLFIDTLCQRIGSKNLWALGNFIVFVAMACTGLITRTVVTPNGPKQHQWSRVAAVVLFTVLGFPLAITYSVPYSLTAELTADSGGGQGLAMGILNLAVVIPQTIVALGAGPWDALFGGGNEPAFGLASLCALAGGVIAVWKLPRLSRHGYQRGVIMHGPH